MGIFNDLDPVDPELGELVIDEFRRVYRSAGARHAFLASARNIYLDKPFGKDGFYPRLAGLEPPAVFIWGNQDKLVPAAFRRHVEEWVPSAEQVTLDGCGHVPQIERPEETARLVRRTMLRGDRQAARARAASAARLPSSADAAARSRRQSAA